MFIYGLRHFFWNRKIKATYVYVYYKGKPKSYHYFVKKKSDVGCQNNNICMD